MIRRWLSRLVGVIWRGLRGSNRQPNLWRRIRRGCRLALILLLLLSCLSCILLGLLVRRATAVEPGSDVMLVIDNSNSMFDKDGIGSDPDLRRIEAAQMFVSYLGIDSGSASHRLGVVFFGGDAELVVPLTPLADDERRDEMASLIAEPQRMDWTNPAAALALSRQTLLAERDEGRQSVVILLTDGKPEWDNDPTQAERQAVIDDLRRIGGRYAEDRIELFVILLTNEATDADPEISDTYVPLWRAITESTRGRFYSVRRAEDLFTIYHDILLTLSDAQSAGPVLEAQLGGDPQREIVAVEPNLARVTFLIRLSHPDVAVALYRPDGRALTPQDTGVRYAGRGTSAIWAIERPESGDWELLLDGQGRVTVWKDFLPAPVTPTPIPSRTITPSPTPAPALIVDVWPEAVLVGQPFTLGVGFEPRPSEPPTVQMAWRVGRGESRPERLLDNGRQGDARAGDGRYSVSLTPACTGTLFAHVWGEVDGRNIASWEGRLRVESQPTLEIVAPEEGETWRAGRTVSVQAHWTLDEDSLVIGDALTATLQAADGRAFAVVTGTVGEGMTLVAPEAAGRYTITVQAPGSLPGSSPFSGEATRTVTVRRPPRIWPWVAGVGLSLAGLVGWGFYRRQCHLPRVAGRLRVLEVPPGYAGPALTDLSLLNRRSVRLGGGDVGLHSAPDGSSWGRIRALPDGSGMELTPCDGRTVRVNGHELSGPHLLSDGDRIAVDGIRLRYEHLHYGL